MIVRSPRESVEYVASMATGQAAEHLLDRAKEGREMQPSASQKALKIVSIISIISGILCIILAALAIFGGAMIGTADPATTADALAESELTQAEAAGAIGFLGILMIIEGAFELIQGFLGLGAAKNNQKIMPVWWICVISLVLDAMAIVASIINGESVINAVTTCAIAAAMFWIANNIKKEAGK